jgi:hypothetical protein
MKETRQSYRGERRDLGESASPMKEGERNRRTERRSPVNVYSESSNKAVTNP